MLEHSVNDKKRAAKPSTVLPQSHRDTEKPKNVALCVCNSVVKARVIALRCATAISWPTDEVMGEHAWTAKGGVLPAIDASSPTKSSAQPSWDGAPSDVK